MKLIANMTDAGGAPSQRFASHDKSRNDTLNRSGAMALALQLEKYWHDRGYPAARFWAVPIDERFDKLGTHELYSVKCNLVNGLPPRLLQ